MQNLGKKAKDKVSGFEGVIISKISYLTGCDQYGVQPPAKDGKVEHASYFDTRRLEIFESVLSPEEVTIKGEPGGPNRDAPGI